MTSEAAIIAAQPERPWEQHPDWAHLLLFAQVEQRTQDELDDVEAVLADIDSDDQYAAWTSHAIALTRRLAEQQRATETRAAQMLGHELPPAEVLAQLARETARTRRRAAPLRAEGNQHEVPCPVKGCCLTVKQQGDTTSEPHLLPINPALADRPYLCSCERQATLTVGRTSRRTWVLREWKPDRDAREEINQIAQALVNGQVFKDRSRERRPDTSPDPTSARLDESGRTMVSLDIRCRQALLDGRIQLALDYAERAEAADYAHRLHRRTYNRHRREEVHTGRWHGGERFWVDLPDDVTPLRYTFDFLAIYDERTGKLTLENADDIELASGVAVGEEGWADLLNILQRIDPHNPEQGKPGSSAGTDRLIYRENCGKLKLRPHLKKHQRALLGLEALRLTLRPLKPRPQDLTQQWPNDLTPDWIADAVAAPQQQPDESNRVRVTPTR